MKYTPERYFLHIEKAVGKAINTYSLIKENDRVAVALSGGKDSLVMLETLARRRKRLPISYEMTAIHVHISNIGYEADLDFINRFCDGLDIPLHIIRAEADLERDANKTICFNCSWLRRKILFDFVQEKRCGRLALGHHRDDAVETLLMNMISGGTVSSIPPLLSMFDGEFDLIRPLILLGEDEIREYARLKNYPPQIKICPHENNTRRGDVKRIIADMKKIDKNAQKNIYNSMSNIHGDYLPPAKK